MPDLGYRIQAFLPCDSVCVDLIYSQSFFVAAGEGASNQRSGEGLL